MANAMVAGVVPWVRYVILTDRLMSDLTAEEIEAVFGHEIGHAKHHHMLYYLGFLVISVVLVALLCGIVGDYLAPYVPFFRSDNRTETTAQVDHAGVEGEHASERHENKADSTLQVLPLVTMLGAYIFVVFGFLSRRCERQADVYGCRAVSCTHSDCGGHDEMTELAAQGRGLCSTGIRTFIEALEKVARLNGISRDKPGWLSSWQHSTIARRVGFLQDVLADRTLERRFQRRVGLVKWALLLGLLATLAALWGAATALAKPSDQQAQDEQSSLVMPHTVEHTAPSE
jgi:STE24 endopeptidase